MLLSLTLSLLQPLAYPMGVNPSIAADFQMVSRYCLVCESGATPASKPEPDEEQLLALRKMLFRTGRPPLLSHDLPQVQLEPSAPVGALTVGSSALRQLQVQSTEFTPYDKYLGVVRDVMSELAVRKKS